MDVLQQSPTSYIRHHCFATKHYNTCITPMKNIRDGCSLEASQDASNEHPPRMFR